MLSLACSYVASLHAGHAEIDGSTEYEYTQSLTSDAVTIPNDEDLAATATLDWIVRLLFLASHTSACVSLLGSCR